MSEVETRDNRRAIILADVLEKTARTFQQQLTSPRQQQQQQQQMKCLNEDISESRSLSAPPPLTPIDDTDTDPLSLSYNAPPTNRGRMGEHHPVIGAKLTKSQPKRRGHIKVNFVYKL